LVRNVKNSIKLQKENRIQNLKNMQKSEKEKKVFLSLTIIRGAKILIFQG
jgi:hypothetical protein